MVKLLHLLGYPWYTEKEVFYAAMRGSLDMVKYLHNAGCPWDDKSIVEAAKNNKMAIVEYLLKVHPTYAFGKSV